MWRWYVEVGFLVLVCFAAGAALAAILMARFLPSPAERSETPADASPGPGSGS